MKLLFIVLFGFFLQFSSTHAAEHVYCKNESWSLQAMFVFYGNLDEGDGFAMLANDGHFLDSSDANARVFSKISSLNNIKIITSSKQPETLAVASDLKKLVVFEKNGRLFEVLTCN